MVNWKFSASNTALRLYEPLYAIEMKQKIQIISIDLMDKYEGTVQSGINGNDYKAFFFGEEFERGQFVDVEFDHWESHLEWDVIFKENKDRKLKLEQAKDSEWGYYGYGKITSIDPIIANFGDIQLELGNWTNDPNVIGEHIYW